MCGIAGLYTDSLTLEARNAEVLLMQRAIAHRGPDDNGVWIDPDSGLGFGHQRLSILDLSHAGHQPMHSSTGRYVLNYNGEIYNYLEIRAELIRFGFSFRGHSDTEVILAAFEKWGFQSALEHFNGMFAIALWDRQEKCLYLTRDRLGEKPLYYGWSGAHFLFASELKAIKASRCFTAHILREGISALMRFSYIPAPLSIYAGIYKLWPGSYMKLTREQLVSGPGNFEPHVTNAKTHAPKQYWVLKDWLDVDQHPVFKGSSAEASQELERLLLSSVELRMLADVPVGAFLSGGIDSSLTVALMQRCSSEPVRTFSIGFYEDGYDEAQYARQVAKHLGTVHTELYLTAEQALKVIPKIPAMYDEPFADSSQIPTFLVAELARQHVKVSLSGDGGDELFWGYPRYFWASRVWNTMQIMPKVIRHAAAAALSVVTSRQWELLFARLSNILPRSLSGIRSPGRKIRRLCEVLETNSAGELYAKLVSHWLRGTELVLQSESVHTLLLDRSSWPRNVDVMQLVSYLDIMTYLPDDLLVKVDRATMRVSLEGRLPLLDHRVVQFAQTLPATLKYRQGQSKWLLRNILYKYVPAQLVDRPKMGFAIPLDVWLRGPLREWAENLLDKRLLAQQGYLNPDLVGYYWQQHLDGKEDWQYYLWDVLMFQAWLSSH